MQLIELSSGPAVTFNPSEALSRAYLLDLLRQNDQLPPTAAADWLDLLFEALHEDDGADLATDEVAA